jgi:hypothetical protein
MARVGRLAGAILAESGGRYFLVGNPKAPCDWEREGFASPGVVDAMKQPYVRLEAKRPTSEVAIGEPYLDVPLEGEALPALLAARFLIERNASVSDRLWRIVTNPEDALEPPARSSIDARWLAEMPAPVWRIVRDSILRCV